MPCDPEASNDKKTVLLFSPRWYNTFASPDIWRLSRKAAKRYRKGDMSYPHDLAIDKPLKLPVPYFCLSIAAYLENNGFSPDIVDLHLEISFRHRIEQHRGNILCIGIECERPFSVAESTAIAHSLRSLLPNVPLIWFGIVPTLFADKFCNEDLADVVVRGQPDVTFLETAKAFYNGNSLSTVEGITYSKSNGELVENPFRPLEFEETSPQLNYSLLPLKCYALGAGDHVVIRTSVGCASKCAFCWFPTIYGVCNKGHSAERVVDDISYLKSEYGLKALTFADQSFFLRKNRVKSICNGLIERGLNVKWRASGQIDLLDRYSDELIELLGQAGCSFIQVGIESGSMNILKLLKKPLNRDMILRTANRLKAANINLIANFIFGLPGESDHDFEDTWKLIRELMSIHPGLLIDYYYYTPYPGNELYDRLRSEGRLQHIPKGNELLSWITFSKYMEKPWFEFKYSRNVKLYYHVVAFDESRVGHFVRQFMKPFISIYKKYATMRVNHDFYNIALDYYLIRFIYSFVYNFHWKRASRYNQP